RYRIRGRPISVVTSDRDDALAVSAAGLDVSHDFELFASLLEIDMQADLAIDELDHLVDRQELSAELLVQRRQRKSADFVPRRRAVIVIVDVDAVRRQAQVDLNVLDTYRADADVAFGGRQPGGSACAAMGVDQRTEDCLRCPA